MKSEKVYATWPQVIFTESVIILAIIFLVAEYLTSGSIEVIKAMVLVSMVGFMSSLYLFLSAMGKYPIMLIKR